MKLWRIAFVMLAAFSLASCSSDDEDYDVNNLAGTWQKVYDEGVAEVFFSATGRQKQNYYPEIYHFFSLVLRKIAVQEIDGL